MSWWTHRVERASPRSRLKRAWWKEAEEFEVVLLTSVFLCFVLVLLDLLLCWGWTRGDYHKGVWLQRDLHSMRVGTWNSFTHTRKRECECLGVWFQMLSFGVGGYELGLPWQWIEGEAETAAVQGRERDKKLWFSVWLLRPLPETVGGLKTVGGLWNFLRVK